MKKTIVIGLIAGSVTAGIICIVNRFQKKRVQSIELDFLEYALGGY